MFYVLSLIGLLAWSCASTGSLGGGPKDEAAPQLLSEESTPDLQTSFTEREAVFVFDEYIKLDTKTPIVVSPPLENRPNYEVKGKKLIISLDEDEQLLENTTYSIQFGSSIQDITESNPYENFSFTFSTGPVLDSLSVSGKVIDQETRKVEKSAVVMLFRSLEDSSFIRGEPDFIAYTDKEGKFSLKHLPSDSFSIVALTDKNSNFSYELAQEKIAFRQKDPFFLKENLKQIELLLIEERPILQGSRMYQKAKNYYRIELNQKSENILVSDPSIIWKEQTGDSIILWTDRRLDSLLLYTDDAIDTVKTKESSDSIEYRKFTMISSSNLWTYESEASEITFANPIDSILIDSLVYVDTAAQCFLKFAKSTSKPRVLSVTGNWKVEQKPRFILPQGLVRDIYGQLSEPDSLVLNIRPAQDRSRLISTISGLDSNAQYIVSLVLGGKEIESKKFSNIESTEIQWENLLVKEHVIEIHLDSNGNGKRDSGSFLKRRKEETIFKEKVNNLRAGWDVELEINIKAL